MDFSLFNQSQKEAVTLSANVKKVSDILIVAGAGSGKTRVVVHRIAYLINEKGVDPQSILGVTFTKKAANEMKERLSALVNQRTRVKLGTFHAICADIIRTFREGGFTIIDDSEQSRLIRGIIRDLGYKDEVTLKEFKLWLSNQRNMCIEPGRRTPSDDDKIIKYREVAIKYKHHKNQLGDGVFDFDDLLEETVVLLKDKPAVKRILNQRWKYMLVDEYQDTNKRQFQIISLLRGVDTQLLQVGDEDQLIYSWRGADIGHIMSSYEKSLIDQSVHCVMLDINYRCSGNVLDLANRVIGMNKTRTSKKLTPNKEKGKPVTLMQFSNCSEEADCLARKALTWNAEGYEFGDMAYLMRTNRMSRSLERAMISNGVPYKLYNGTAMFDSREIRLMMSLLWFASDPTEAFYLEGITDVIKLGIGAATLPQLNEQRKQAGEDWVAFLSSHPSYGTKSSVKELVEFYIDAKVHIESGSLGDAARSWFHNWDILAFFKKEDRERKSETITAFFDVLDDYEETCRKEGRSPTISDFQEQRLLNDALLDTEKPGVHLMTIHKAKGLEFKVGAIVGIQDGVFPMDPDNISGDSEEDYRLAYVAITRFMDELVLSRTSYRVGFNNISGYSVILDDHLYKMLENDSVRIDAH